MSFCVIPGRVKCESWEDHARVEAWPGETPKHTLGRGWKVMSNGSKGSWEEWQEEKKNGRRPITRPGLRNKTPSGLHWRASQSWPWSAGECSGFRIHPNTQQRNQLHYSAKWEQLTERWRCSAPLPSGEIFRLNNPSNCAGKPENTEEEATQAPGP